MMKEIEEFTQHVIKVTKAEEKTTVRNIASRALGWFMLIEPECGGNKLCYTGEK